MDVKYWLSVKRQFRVRVKVLCSFVCLFFSHCFYESKHTVKSEMNNGSNPNRFFADTKKTSTLSLAPLLCDEGFMKVPSCWTL